MKLYKPLFSIIIIVIQLILSIKDYFGLEKWRENNPELNAIIEVTTQSDTLFVFVLSIGVYEMTTKSSWFKTFIRTFLVCIVFGYQFSSFIPIEGFRFGVYNTAWLSAVLVPFLVLFRFGK